MTNFIRFTLNGNAAQASCRADTTVLEWLRGEALLRGSKEGCAEGDCGACSVLVKRPATRSLPPPGGEVEAAQQVRVGGDTGKLSASSPPPGSLSALRPPLQGEVGSLSPARYQAANSCIMLMGQLEGASLVTVEGLAALNGDGDENGHAVQKAMAENGSSQCGFCTPGIVVALAGLLDQNSKPDDAAIHDALAGNLCRCTGYRPIVEAAHAAAKAQRQSLPDSAAKGPGGAEVGNDGSTFHLPNNLKDLLSLRATYPDAILLAGGTDLSLDVAHARARWGKAILTRDVAELRAIEASDTHLTFGGAVTWEEALPHLHKHWPSFATLVRRFGSTQIRSMGTIAGNLGTASPIGDGAPALLALGAYLTLADEDGERELVLDDFFLDYRKSALKPGEIIRSIRIPLPSSGQQFRVYKVSKRYDQDISTVCGAFALETDGDKVIRARIAFGGMAAVPKRCVEAEEVLAGNILSGDTVAAAKQAIRDTFTPMTDMRGTADYRSLVAANLVERLALDLAGEAVEVMALEAAE